ncbi:MAG TPA: hypothetical protein VGM21_15780 [Actinomycetota bacterium]|jgi:hypothetical protein
MTTTRTDAADAAPAEPAVQPSAAPAEDGAGAPAPPAERPAKPPAAAEVPGPAGQPAPEAATFGLPQLTRMLGTIVAPTTLLTSLLFYFGWSHAWWFFRYFGVDWTLLGLSNRDFVMRSLDGLFVPLTVVAAVGLLVLWGHALLRARLAVGARPRVVGLLPTATAVAGLVLAGVGITAIFSVFVRTRLNRYVPVAPLSLALGVLLLVYAVQLRRLVTERPRGGRAAWAAVAEWAAVFVLVGLSLFWAATDYSAAVGSSRARQFVAELPGYPDAVVYSARSLSLHAPGVREVRCHDPEAAYRYRYDGLKLMLQSGDQYLFLPAGWSRANGVAILVPRSDSLRLEFLPPSRHDRARRVTC